MASLTKLIKKFNNAKAAINSYKGILSKLKSINYEGVLSSDQLKEQYDEAREQLQNRKSSLDASLSASNTAQKFAQRRPTGTTPLIFPISEPCNNWIAFTTRPRPGQQTNSSGNRTAGTSDATRYDIQLYVPDDSITSSASVTYEATEVGQKQRAISSFLSGEQGFTSAGMTVVKDMVISSLEGMSGGMANFVYGRAKNPLKEQMLSGIDFREHTFNFELWPRSAEEGDSIKQICNAFKTSMLPGTSTTNDTAIFNASGQSVLTSSDETQNFFTYPDLFEIEWRGPIANKVEGFMPCVLTKCTINQSSQMYKEGHPLFTKIELSFTEIMIMTKNNWETYVSPDRENLDASADDPMGTI
jgi:hypothetical protein